MADNKNLSNAKDDLSVLRKPIKTSINGILELIKIYEEGTIEVKQLLKNECDIIYECRVCRSMFRSLLNFISHKRIYCNSRFNATHHNFFRSDGFIDQELSTIINAEQEYVQPNLSQANVKLKKTNKSQTDVRRKDLTSIVEKLLSKQKDNCLLKLTDFYDQINTKLTQEDILVKYSNLQLDNIPDSNVAVYQSLDIKQEEQTIKTEVNEIHQLLLKNETVLGPDGKSISLNTSPETPNIIHDDSEDPNTQNYEIEPFSCDICNCKFATQKTLKLHLKTKHIPTTFVYPCPTCSKTFLQPAAVLRHLSNDHKKSAKRIRMMRENILKKRIRANEVQLKSANRELTQLQRDKMDDKNKSWNLNNDDSHVLPTCCHCGKQFERKAVLTAHMMSCSQKNIRQLVAKKKVIPNTTKTSIECPIINNNQCINNDDTSNSTDSFGDLPTKNIIGKSNFHSKLETNRIVLDSTDSIETANNDTDKDSLINKRKPKRTLKTVKCEGNTIINSELVNGVEPEVFWEMGKEGNLSLKAKTFHEVPDIQSTKESVLGSINTESATCSICGKTFANHSNLRRHISLYHYSKEKSINYCCKLCDYQAHRKSDVIFHMGSVHNLMGDLNIVSEFIVEKSVDLTSFDMNADYTITENNKFIQSQVILPIEECTVDVKANLLEVSTDEVNDAVGGNTENNNKKRGRPKGSKTNSPDLTEERKPMKITRSSQVAENQSLTTITGNTNKRPVRNRIKPVNKDFVYDLSNLLKKDSDVQKLYKEQQQFLSLPQNAQLKKRNFLQLTDGISKLGKSKSLNQKSLLALKFNYEENEVRKAALKMAIDAVEKRQAVFDIPNRMCSKPIIDGFENFSSRCDLTVTLGNKRRVSDDELLHRKKTRKCMDGLETATSTSTSNLIKLNSKLQIPVSLSGTEIKLVSKSADNSEDEIREEEKITVKCPTEIEFQQYLIANKIAKPVCSDEPENLKRSIYNNTSPNSNRISVLQRMNENKAKQKQQHSLLRKSKELKFENDDNDQQKSSSQAVDI